MLSIGLNIQRIPKSASLLSTVPKSVQKASMVGFRSLNASRYQQYQSKLWYQTDTSGSGSVLAHVLSMQTALHTSLLPLPRFALLSCTHVTLHIGGQHLERGVFFNSKHRDRSMDLLSKWLRMICSCWHKSAHFVSREYLYWCQDPQHWFCIYLISDH